MLLTTIAAACVVPAFSDGAPIDPLRQGHVPGAATTLVHFDFSHAAATTLGRDLLAHMAETNEDDFLGEFTTDLGIEFGEDIRSMTIYSAGSALGASARNGTVSVEAGGDEDAVLLIYGSDALRQWDEALAQEQDDLSPDLIGGRPVREIDEDDQHWLAVMLPHEGGRLWAIAAGLERLESAVAVIDGRAERADLAEWPVAGPSEGAFLYIAVRDFEQLERWEPTSDVARRTEGFALSLGQHEGDGFARVQITVEQEEDAEAVVGICQGVIGLARLTLSKSEEMRPLLRLLGAIHLTTDGRLVEASLVKDAAELRETLRALEGEGIDEEVEEIDEPQEDEREDDRV